MDELIQSKKGTNVEFYLGEVTSYTIGGVKVRLDGEESGMNKQYKMLKTGKPLVVGDRVVVMKMSGSYVILGALDKPATKSSISNLETTASTGIIALRFNSLLSALRAQGIIGGS